jgi:hypothetical protein
MEKMRTISATSVFIMAIMNTIDDRRRITGEAGSNLEKIKTKREKTKSKEIMTASFVCLSSENMYLLFHPQFALSSVFYAFNLYSYHLRKPKNTHRRAVAVKRKRTMRASILLCS